VSKLTLNKNASAPATPAADKLVVYLDSDGKLKAKTDAGAVVVLADVVDAVLKTLIDAKGDLLVGTAADTIARKAVGANGKQLYADSGQSDGMRWDEPTKDAHWFRQAGTSPIERWYTNDWLSSLVNVTLNAAKLTATPYFTGRGGTLDRIAINCQGAGDGTSRVRLGIYGMSSETNMYPGALLVDSGELDTSTTGIKSATISLALPANSVVWLACLANTSAPMPQVRGGSYIAHMASAASGFDSTLIADPKIHWEAAVTYGALPDPYPASAPAWTFSYPAVFVRYSA
jgi:hypothetical protein